MNPSDDEIVIHSIPLRRVKAKKEHACNPYFSPECQGNGRILAGSHYWLVQGDFRADAFHPYRCCESCANVAGSQPQQMSSSNS